IFYNMRFDYFYKITLFERIVPVFHFFIPLKNREYLNINFVNSAILGWALAGHRRTELCLAALQMAYWRRKPDKGLIYHSDRGSQYTSSEYGQHLSVMGMRASHSDKGSAGIMPLLSASSAL
ncbi:DDE-type integrase/transposase/recombinase, partial [Candidatus Williamhamiltonella defendens]|uniref:DDE-type integrase/transposase/recombinase n=2 Tax=Candidatus Williamhamiltonella defendens TaxID=138072 RepID=UPI001582320F